MLWCVCVLGVPSPRRLHLERQFTRSVLLSWKPADLPADQVKGYSVYANGELRLMIKGSSKTKALLEDIDPQEVISAIRCLFHSTKNVNRAIFNRVSKEIGDCTGFSLRIVVAGEQCKVAGELL